MEVRVIASLVAKPEFIDAVNEAVHLVIEPSREEKGNLQYDLHAESGQKSSLCFSNAGHLMMHWKNIIKPGISTSLSKPLRANWKALK